MLSFRLVLEICGLRVVVSFNFALGTRHVKRRVKSCEPSAAAASTGQQVSSDSVFMTQICRVGDMTE